MRYSRTAIVVTDVSRTDLLYFSFLRLHLLILHDLIAFCRSSSKTVYVVKKAPKYGNTCPPPDIQSEYFAPEGAREVVVTWTPPSATDEDGDIKR